jgi:nicotinamidase-related amidase
MRIGFGEQNAWTVDDDRVSLVRPVVPPRPYLIEAVPRDIVIDLERSALVVVDMQNDFLHDDGWFAEKGVTPGPLRKPIPVINAAAKYLRGLGMRIVWLNWGNRPDRLNIPPGLAFAGKREPTERGYGEPGENARGNSLERGSWGASMFAAMEVAPNDLTVDKIRFGGFTGSELDSVLRNIGIHTLILAGINTDRCVFATLMDATFHGYDAILLEDGVATPSPEACTQAVHFLVDKLFGFRIRSDDLLAGHVFSK